MEPSIKKRKLAPKLNSLDPISQPAHPHETVSLLNLPHYPASEAAAAPISERHDFESFARHLQDAAMLIQRQTERPAYSDVSVLLLRWEEDVPAEDDLVALEQLLSTHYRFQTQKWYIPTVPNPSIKLGVQMAQFLDNARPNHLLIIYYAGHGFVGLDGQLYWACNARDDAAKLKYDGIRCLFEDAQSDILLFLDTCGIPDPAASGSHGVKQAIAACHPDQPVRGGPSRSFTSLLIEALHKLETGRPFSAQRLHEEIISLQQRHSNPLQAPNGINSQPLVFQTPFFFTLTPGKGQSLTLAPVAGRTPTSSTEGDTRGQEENLINPDSVTDLRFDEARILVCTTFVGDASPDMSFFHQWLQNTPAMGTKIAVEGMFLGPPTMLLISMPHSVWNVVQHDKVCCFLGYISSHNMLHLYEKLITPSSVKASTRDGDDRRMSFAAGDLAVAPGHLDSREHPYGAPLEPIRAHRPSFQSQESPKRPSYQSIVPPSNKPSREREGTAEMREAAEQLKALSHVRHRSEEGLPSVGRQRTTLPNGMADMRVDGASSHEAYDSGTDDPTTLHDGKSNANRVKVPRRAPSKHETQCTHCSHAPFRDSSSLRKHIAAAHTRPFPCAFSFAGCTSTFGSKNEWKRHITSQHLCLQFYRCSSCPQSAAEGKGNEFNRKDLFTQHLRRMHAPFHIKRAVSKGDPKMQAEWEAHVKSMQQSCLVQRRHPPQKSACPKHECQTVFEGAGSWDEWTEHVGRHMEKGEGHNLDVDGLLVEWALKEKIIKPTANGEFKLCANQHGESNANNGENGVFLERRNTLEVVTRPSPSEDTSMRELEIPAVAMEVDR